jgi:hypothetical protein
MVYVAPCVGNVTELVFAVDVALTPSTEASSRGWHCFNSVYSSEWCPSRLVQAVLNAVRIEVADCGVN